MAKAKKFGTFSGVFTPSILTILGVIMYLRFPSIIGQAGLINTIGIIIIAHIISITTSLSVASLSTDKPVQNGGTYFMISRSLGLPIGGTLGLALFVGLSFSVSLYLIGFAESFLQYWGLENNIENIRLTGTIVLIAVTTITFISTSLAIKSQYFIMAAIGLSLLSIFFGHHDYVPDTINLKPLANAAPFMILFGIFFPAVTGFEAGVSMSGDLKNPKKSLPLGAIMAVGVGFIVYIGLAIFYALTVDANALVTDPKILFKISLVPELVIAGIWGATLSSALGSILGAPRILQAIAMDKIAPKFLAKGTGKTNEPRNALLLAFVIAEAGILIGELNLIARIVSMFFITTYAFLNLASAIESWSSSDFRPAFKIPKFVSILGTLSAFIVMILLDFLALAGATVVLGLLYFYLQRKELILESGDAWSSFWTNLAKRSLLKLSTHKTEKRNWRPNIILFSGGKTARPYLIDLGLSLTGKLGALTDFNLVTKNNQGETDIKGHARGKKNKIKNANYFTRHFFCNSIEDGIKTVTSVYGFSGFEPNTVLMGWSRENTNLNLLVNVLEDLKNKSLNALFLEYDKVSGFGKNENIDIWWNGKGRHLTFSLNIVKFLLSDPKWRDAKIRILIINNDTSINDSIYRNTSALLSEDRIRAEIKILNNDFGSRTTTSIIKTESANSDLVLLGLSQHKDASATEYLEKMNTLTKLPCSTLLLWPTEEFEEINLTDPYFKRELPGPEIVTPVHLPAIVKIENTILKSRLAKMDADLLEITDSLSFKTFHEVVSLEQHMLKNIRDFVDHNQQGLVNELSDKPTYDSIKTWAKYQQIFLRSINQIVKTQNPEIIQEIRKSLEAGIHEFLSRTGNYLFETSEFIHLTYKIPSKKKEKNFKIQYRKTINHYLYTILYPNLMEQLNLLDETSVNLFTDIRMIIFDINDHYEKQLINLKSSQKTSGLKTQDFSSLFKKIEYLLANFENKAISTIQFSVRAITNEIAINFSNPESINKSRKKIKGVSGTFNDQFNSYAENWGNATSLINNTLFLDTLILSDQKIAKNIIQGGNERIIAKITDLLLKHVNSLINNLEKTSKENNPTYKSLIFPENLQIRETFNDSYKKIIETLEELPAEIELPEVIYKDTLPLAFDDYNSLLANINKSANYFVDTLFFEPFYREMEQLEKQCEQTTIECKEANSLLLFRINNIQSSQNEVTNQDSEREYIEKLIAQIKREKEKLENFFTSIQNNASKFLEEAYANLFYHAILESEKRISSKKREQQSKKLSIGITKRLNTLKEQFNSLIANILNTTSSGIILSRKYLSELKEEKVQIKNILDLIDQITPNKKVYNNVPVFYRSLMSSASKINDEFWVSREFEMDQIKSALKRHKNGLGGAVLIKGVHGAGKTSLSRFAAHHLFKRKNIFWINPPVNGSINVEDFLNELRKQVVSFGDFSDIFVNIPHESVVVLNDLELWWERSTNGSVVLEKIFDLIEMYGNKVFFILNCNTFSFNIIKKIVNIEDHLLSIINCESFNTRQLQFLIMSRHKSSGLNLKYRGKNEDEINQLSSTFLFNAFFNFSGGVPGIAMNTWKANIIESNQESLTVQKPKKPNADIINKLDPEWFVVIALFIQHKNLNAIKLSRITGFETSDTEKMINNLFNAGLIVEKSNKTYTLGRNIEPFLAEACMNKGII